MRGCLRVLAGLVAVLFLITAVIALFAVNLVQGVTDREAVKEAVQELDELILDAAPALLVRALKEQAAEQNLPPVEIDSAVLQEAIGELLPPDWLAVQLGKIVDALFDFLETGDVSAMQIELDARPFLERVRGEPGRRATLVVLQSLPTCAVPQPEIDWRDGVQIPMCINPNQSVPEMAKDVHAAVVETIDRNPQFLERAGVVELSLLGEGELTPQREEELQRLHELFVLGQRWIWLLWLVPLTCLLLILLLAVRTLAEFGHWWGWPLLITAVVALLLAILGPAIIAVVVQTAVTPPPEVQVALELPVGQFVRQVLQPFLDLWMGRIYLQAGIMLAAGVALVIVGFMTEAARHLEG